MADAPRIELGRDGRKPVYLDVAKLLTTKMLVQANSGGGKSYAVRVLAEQAMTHIQTVVIDPDGEFASLRELHDILLVGEDGDLPPDPRGAALLARRLFEKRCSAVIDLYELDPPQREEFVRDFCNALVKIPKPELAAHAHPMLVIIDEAQDFCPDRNRGTSLATKAVISLVARGRKRGMGVVLATQRLSEISKSVAYHANNYMCGRTAHDTDRKRVGHDLGLEKGDQDGLRNLDEGQFWALGPAFSHRDCRKIRVGHAKTTHPEPGTAMPPPPPASKRIRSLIGREFTDLPERAREEATNLGDANERIRCLEQENADLRAKRIHPENEERLRAVQRELDHLVERTTSAVQDLDRAKARLTVVRPSPESPRPTPVVIEETPNHRMGVTGGVFGKPSPPQRMRTSTLIRANKGNGKSAFHPMEQKILDDLAWLEAAHVESPHRKQLAWAHGCHPRNNGFEKRLGKLKGEGWIDYPQPGHIQLTQAGRACAKAPTTAPTTKQLQERIYSRLPPRRIKLLQLLVQRYPNDYHRTECAEQHGVHPRNNSYEKDLGAMRSVGLVTYPKPGRVRAGPMMFLN